MQRVHVPYGLAIMRTQSFVQLRNGLISSNMMQTRRLPIGGFHLLYCKLSREHFDLGKLVLDSCMVVINFFVRVLDVLLEIDFPIFILYQIFLISHNYTLGIGLWDEHG